MSDYPFCPEHGMDFPCPICAAVEARVQAAIDSKEQNPWKRAIIEGLTKDFLLSPENKKNPTLALAELISWNCKIALDPSVSNEAATLVQAAAVEMRERCAKTVMRVQVNHGTPYIAHFARSDDAPQIAEAVHQLPTPTDALDKFVRVKVLEAQREALNRFALSNDDLDMTPNDLRNLAKEAEEYKAHLERQLAEAKEGR